MKLPRCGLIENNCATVVKRTTVTSQTAPCQYGTKRCSRCVAGPVSYKLNTIRQFSCLLYTMHTQHTHQREHARSDSTGVSLPLTGMEAGLLTTTTSSSMCTMAMGSAVTGTSCLQQTAVQSTRTQIKGASLTLATIFLCCKFCTRCFE